MTGEEQSRITKLINREDLDRVPVVMNIGLYAAYISNISSKEYYLNSDSAYSAQIWAHKLHRDDGGLSFFMPGGEVEVFGGKLSFDSSSRISLPKPLKKIVESESDLRDLSVPDIEVSKYLKTKLEFDRKLFLEGESISVSSGSPMNVAVNIVEIELLLRWMKRAPELVHRVMRIATDYLLEVIDYYIKEFGASKCIASSSYPVESHNLISPKDFERFSLPYIIEINEKLLEKNLTNWSIHLCGDHKKNLKYWTDDISLPKRSIITIGDEMDLKSVSSVFGRDYIIGGNVDTTLLQIGSPQDVYEECRMIIGEMKYSDGGFILSPACSLPSHARPVNVHAMLEAVDKFGRY